MSDLTPEAQEEGQDPTLVSEPTVEELTEGLVEAGGEDAEGK